MNNYKSELVAILENLYSEGYQCGGADSVFSYADDINQLILKVIDSISTDNNTEAFKNLLINIIKDG